MMFRTKAPTGSPTDVAVLLRMPDRPLPYRAGLRGLDVISGRRDGRRHLGGPMHDRYRLDEDATAWQRHNTHRLNERLAAEDLTYQSLALQLTARATELVSAITTAEDTLSDAQDALEEARGQAPALTVRRATEAHLSPEQVAKRRGREHDTAVLAPALARVKQARAALEALQRERDQIHATVAALAQVMQSRKDRLAEFHQRRGHVYERAYLRHANNTPIPAHA